MQVDSYPPDVACAGPEAPKCGQIDELIRLLVTIRERWGNTAVRYNVNWGASALWVEDAQAGKIRKLQQQVKRLKGKR